LAAAKKNFRVFELPLLRNAKNLSKKRDKKIEQNNRGRTKKPEEKKPHVFAMSPDVFFGFLNSLVMKRPKT
jgi:hypothetical protein